MRVSVTVREFESVLSCTPAVPVPNEHFFGLLRIVHMLLEIFIINIASECIRRTRVCTFDANISQLKFHPRATSSGSAGLIYDHLLHVAITRSLPVLRTWKQRMNWWSLPREPESRIGMSQQRCALLCSVYHARSLGTRTYRCRHSRPTVWLGGCASGTKPFLLDLNRGRTCVLNTTCFCFSPGRPGTSYLQYK